MITVKELIEHLETLDQDSPVIITHDSWLWGCDLLEVTNALYLPEQLRRGVGSPVTQDYFTLDWIKDLYDSEEIKEYKPCVSFGHNQGM